MESGMGEVCRILVPLGESAGEEKAFSKGFKETALLNYFSLLTHLYSGWTYMHILYSG